jgi:nucleotide-binding universal stress UspA family protein
MSGIVCAVRGGPNSRHTIDRAVALANETGLALHFLYVVNLNFLTHTVTSRVRTISEEMRSMGESILYTAQTQAQDQGVTAQAVVRHGNVLEEISKLCHELSADYLVLGRPGGEQEHDVFTEPQQAHFQEQIEHETGAKVVLAEGG